MTGSGDSAPISAVAAFVIARSRLEVGHAHPHRVR
jgi:hypothetical protein